MELSNNDNYVQCLKCFNFDVLSIHPMASHPFVWPSIMSRSLRFSYKIKWKWTLKDDSIWSWNNKCLKRSSRLIHPTKFSTLILVVLATFTFVCKFELFDFTSDSRSKKLGTWLPDFRHNIGLQNLISQTKKESFPKRGPPRFLKIWPPRCHIRCHFNSLGPKVCPRPIGSFDLGVSLVLDHTVRYVGVIWFIFHVLQFLTIRFTQQNSHYIITSTMKHLQKPDWK